MTVFRPREASSLVDKKKFKEHPKTVLDFYIVGRVLGKGAFGKVNLCVHKLSGKLVAIKSLHKQYLASEHNNAKFRNEISILRQLHHKSIMRLYETFSSDTYLLIVVELCSGGDLLTYVRKRRRLAEPIAKFVFKQILDGLSYCHSKGIVHRDIKLDNILLNESGNVKIGDFGVSKKVTRGKKLHDRCGTPAYIAPEILKDAGYDGDTVDVWSAGVVLYAMLYGNFPFKAASVEELESLIIEGEYTLPEDISMEARDLIGKILQPEPDERVGIAEIMDHPWMKHIDETCKALDADPSVVSIFTPEEIESIKQEYSFKEHSQDDSAADEASSSMFTEHKLDTTDNDAENDPDMSKSTVLAPFNSVDPNGQELIEDLTRQALSRRVIKFHSKLRELDRRYERNNNSQLDNGVYVQPVGGASAKGYGGKALSTPSTPGQQSPKSLDHNKGLLSLASCGKGTAASTAQSFYTSTPNIGTSCGLYNRIRPERAKQDGEGGLRQGLCHVLLSKQ